MDDEVDPGPSSEAANNQRANLRRGRGRSSSVQRSRGAANDNWRNNRDNSVYNRANLRENGGNNRPNYRGNGNNRPNYRGNVNNTPNSRGNGNNRPNYRENGGNNRPNYGEIIETNVQNNRNNAARRLEDLRNQHRAPGMQRASSLSNVTNPHYRQPSADRRGAGRRGAGDAPHDAHHRFTRDQNNKHNNFGRKKYIGFKRLEEIAQSESQDALTKIMESKDAFIDLIQSPIERFDMFVLIVECLAKVCQSSFDELKLSLLKDTCNSNFIVSLKSYLLELPYAQSKGANNFYWKDQNAFWRSMIIFYESVLNTSPTLALNKCRSLMEATTTACLDGLKERHAYVLPEEFATKFTELRERLANLEKVKTTSHSTRKGFQPENGAPPESFRELSIMPTKDDLLERKAFVRPNIVDGSYEDVEHYLDVQFRLLREDCFGPLRDGLYQYIADPKRKKYDNIRVFHNVKFVKPYVSQTKVGSLVQVDVKNNKMFKRINWNHSKRFIFGSLVLFTKDNCHSFIVATILDRDAKYLTEGMIPVSIMGAEFDERLYDEQEYTMIESEVYFEPYYHVLKALQDPAFPEHIAMKQYIVDVNPEPRHPLYLNIDTEYSMTDNFEDQSDCEDENPETETELGNLIQLGKLEKRMAKALIREEAEKLRFKVLQEMTWPDKEMFHFNETQLEAYKLALTHEFAVIQGPPGTGKTYIGIKVAKTLFENLKANRNGCLMLVICYTNHALDQFLEALMEMTESIVRIGGQSRNEAMDKINITKLRSTIDRRCQANQVFYDKKSELRILINHFQQELVNLDVLLNGVMRSSLLDVPQIEYLERFYGHSKQDGIDPLANWLFEHNSGFYTDLEALLMEENDTGNTFVELEKETRKRTGVVLDDQEENEKEMKSRRLGTASFHLEDAKTKLKAMISDYRKSENPHELRELQYEIQYQNSLIEMFYEMSTHRSTRMNMRIDKDTNFQQIHPRDRWILYFTWIHDKVTELKQEIGELQARLVAAGTAYEEARMLLDMQVLRHRKIVGMTTSGAARMRKLLQTLAPPIVIVEEAAEVLEQHIITSLTKDCQHLILIGDHQQLRPSASHMKLARHYNIEVSLFERMITNGIHSRRLGVQHRMRPEIAALICPHIYAELENHPSVYDFPDVKGMTKNMFFFTHDHKEEEVVENQSRTNQREADLVLGLANYLMQQGYAAEEVTILAAYKGQMFYLRKESEKYTHLGGVKITVVDMYQGEESKIILLSLVRNNDENKIGFLGTANRICVALSRAKEGFYMFGNIDTLKASSELWRNIATTLENSNALGTSLTLKCQNHPDNLTTISKLEDFNQTPEGGCTSKCDIMLPSCGHKCLLFCHGYDREHTTTYTRCTLKCERILCELGHVCPKRCANKCDECKVKMLKTLPCGHDMRVDCYLEPDDPRVKCFTLVRVKLPDCGHEVEKMCYVDTKDVRCSVKCEYRVEKCGHVCSRNCHVKDDPDHENFLCMKACARAKKGCTAGLEGDRGDHQCQKRCHDTCDDCVVQVQKKRSNCKHMERIACNANIDEKPCQKKCSRKLPCDHFCKKKCFEACGDCKEMVKKVIPDCKHEIKIICQKEATRDLCKRKCERTMSCGHKCTGECWEPCKRENCTELSAKKVRSPCGHDVALPCNLAALPADKVAVERILSACSAPCSAELSCGHACGGSCARCRRGALHAPCTQPCGRDNICGHQCTEPCNQICPPCKKTCEVRCQHSRCRQLCGAPCTPCREQCKRRCLHGECSQRCGEACSREACDLPCPRTLRCGHPCRGLCGEPCPPVCRVCRPDDYPRDFLGDEFDDDARFVLLQDCGHIMEVENMDNLMLGDRDTVSIRSCPFCRKPIINTGRYKDLVNATFKNEINPIKERVYGTDREIETKKKELTQKIKEFRDEYSRVILADKNCKSVYLSLQSIAKTKKKVSKLQLDMEFVCLNILDMIAECYNTYIHEKHTELKTELCAQTELLCNVFQFKVNSGVMLKVSEQQQNDLKFEIKRLNAIVQLAKLMSHQLYAVSKSTPKVASAFSTAKSAVFTITVFDEDKAMEALKHLQDAVKVSGVVTKQERDLIVKAMGFSLGHWYKCPNGHIYCIGDCGGAMEESRCPECGSTIGGRNHALTAGNAHAPEMDGSRHAAWSEAANMENFDLDNIL